MAGWCLLTRQTPHTYRSLTTVEREAFLAEAQRLKMIERG